MVYLRNTYPVARFSPKICSSCDLSDFAVSASVFFVHLITPCVASKYPMLIIADLQVDTPSHESTHCNHTHKTVLTYKRIEFFNLT